MHHHRLLVLFGLTATIAAVGFASSASAALCLPILCTPSGGGGSGAPPSPGPPATTGDVIGTVSAYANPARTGYVADPTLVPPFNVRWARVVHHSSGQTLYGDGRIFVILDGSLRALDPATGGDLWAVPVASTANLQAVDAGRLFVVDGPSLRAFSAATGQLLWTASTAPESGGFTGAMPVAINGLVYATTPLSRGTGNDTELVALDAATGQVRWAQTATGSQKAPTVADGRLFLVDDCYVAAWQALTGQPLWKDTKCTGGTIGGRPRPYYSGRLRDFDGAVYDPVTGTPIENSGVFYQFADGVAIRTEAPNVPGLGSALVAFDVQTKRQLWRHQVPRGVTQTIATEPLIAGGTVYTLSNNRLSGYVLHTGQHVFSGDIALTKPSDDVNSFDSWLGAAPGLLLVSGRRYVLGLESAFHPAATAVQVDTTATDIQSGARMKVGGELGSALRAGKPRITVQEDLAPFGGGWHTIGHPSANSDGFFELALRPDRNVRLRALAGGATSKSVKVYAYPRYHFRVSLSSGHRLRISFSVTGPRRGLSGRRAVIYLGRVAKHRYQRLGSGVLHGAHGRFRGVAHGPVPSHTHTKDTITLCVKGGPRLGLGRASTLDRHCGARSVRMPR